MTSRLGLWSAGGAGVMFTGRTFAGRMFVGLMLAGVMQAWLSSAAVAGRLYLDSGMEAGTANGEPLVKPDCANSSLKISPCGKVAQSWLDHLNSRTYAFSAAFRAAGYSDPVATAVLDCSAGVYNPRKTRGGQRNSRHAYAEACDGNFVKVNGIKFSYAKAVNRPASRDRRFFVTLLDAWGKVGPGCVPEKGYTVLGMKVGCRPVMADNCGVIDWRERGRRGQYGSTYHLSFCLYTDTARAYE